MFIGVWLEVLTVGAMAEASVFDSECVSVLRDVECTLEIHSLLSGAALSVVAIR